MDTLKTFKKLRKFWLNKESKYCLEGKNVVSFCHQCQICIGKSHVGVAQLVEHITHKDKVASSILAVDTTQDIALFNESVYTLATAGVAQLVRALPCHGRGRGFESLRSRRYTKDSPNGLSFVMYLRERRDSKDSLGVPLGQDCPGRAHEPLCERSDTKWP